MMFKGMMPEQIKFFQEHGLKGKLADLGEFYPPFYLYINGVHERSWHNDSEYDIAIDEQASAGGKRAVLLDNYGDVIAGQEYEEDKLLFYGDFELVYTIDIGRVSSGEAVRRFFEEHNDLCFEDAEHINPDALAQATFEDADFTDVISREFVLNLRQIAKLYPLLEIRLYS